MIERDLLTRVLLAPGLVSDLSLADWDLLVRQGRRCNLLARLAHLLTEKGLLDTVPDAPKQHLLSSLCMVERQHVAMRWEVACIEKALSNCNVKVVLLKGAAYVVAGLPAAVGRTFSDVDILVPKQQLGLVEEELKLHGWQGSHHDAYDQGYYRRWMHEIPPMRHVKRGTTIDVHHAIVPESARIKVNTPALFERPVAVPGHEKLFVLQPTDMVLHSAAHLFLEGGLENGLRDLLDLDHLFRHFGSDPEFWAMLVPRATVLGLTRPLFYALRYTCKVLGTPIPDSVVRSAEISQPPTLIRWCMDFSYLRALRPDHASCDLAGTPLARFVLYVRSHWLRMPFPRLAYHLTRKAIMRLITDADEEGNRR